MLLALWVMVTSKVVELTGIVDRELELAPTGETSVLLTSWVTVVV